MCWRFIFTEGVLYLRAPSKLFEVSEPVTCPIRGGCVAKQPRLEEIYDKASDRRCLRAGTWRGVRFGARVGGATGPLWQGAERRRLGRRPGHARKADLQRGEHGAEGNS